MPKKGSTEEPVPVPFPRLVLLSTAAFGLGWVLLAVSSLTDSGGLALLFVLLAVSGAVTFRRLKYAYDRPVDGGLRSFSGGPMADIDFLRSAWAAWRSGRA